MSYEKRDAKVEVKSTAPVEIIPFAEAFKEDLYNLYKVYKPDVEQIHYSYDN